MAQEATLVWWVYRCFMAIYVYVVIFWLLLFPYHNNFIFLHNSFISLYFSTFSVDNSEWMRNGDFIPTRLDAQGDAINMACRAKLRQNPENTVGLMSLAEWVKVCVCGGGGGGGWGCVHVYFCACTIHERLLWLVPALAWILYVFNFVHTYVCTCVAHYLRVYVLSNTCAMCTCFVRGIGVFTYTKTT